MALTFAQMYNLTSQSLMDKGGDPYMPSETFDELANNATNIYCGKLYDEFQKTQEISDKLSPLVISFTKTAITQIVPSTGFTNYWHLLPMEGLSVYDCGGVTKSEWRPIVPLKFKQSRGISSDPFNKPSERNIYYTESADLIEILSLGALNVRGNYLKTAQIVDYTNNPTTASIFSNDVCEAICRMVAEQYWLTLGVVNNVQVQGSLNQQSK
jgi:hypothetical protein